MSFFSPVFFIPVPLTLPSLPSQVPEDTALYSALGRMFMLSDKASIKTKLDNEKDRETKREEDLKSRAAYLQRKLQSNEATLKDLYSQLQQKS